MAARSPGPSDARVPCPLCGGLIHPIAGRCKHCKADVAAHRGARPAAVASLPPLAQPAFAPPIATAPDASTLVQPVAVNPALARAPYAPQPLAATTITPAAVPAAPVPVLGAPDESRPILPPRPTGRMQTTEPSRSLWRNWPVIVIVIAVLAIAAAVVLMLWPPGNSAKADSRRLAPPPAPERMDTNPLPPRDPGAGVPPSSGSPDPWSNRGGTRTPPPPPPDPDDQSSIDPDDLLQDPFANPRSGSGLKGNPYGGNPFGTFGGTGIFLNVLDRMCTKVKTCGNTGAADFCTILDQMPAQPLPQGCVAAQRCMSAIDRLDLCNSTSLQSDLTQLFSTVQDCVDAMRC